MRNRNHEMINSAKAFLSEENGEEYLGYVEDGKKQGYGELKMSEEKRYYGYFKDNLPHIKGVLIFSAEHYYMGQFANGKMHGKGKEISPNFTFEGEYSNDCKKYGKLVT